MIRNSGLALGIVVLTASIAAAQPPAGGGQRGGGQPAAATNLQILPKDTSPQVVNQTMQGFTQALGVQCSYCHEQNRALDDKPTKKTARQMMILARDLNEKLPVAVSKSAADTTRIECATCHRGVAIPKALADILTATVSSKGVDAAVAQYKELRTKYFGGMAYDFSENALATMAQRAVAADQADTGLAWLNLNLEFYPKSARTYQVMAQAHQKKNDKDAAIKDLEKAVELDPNNNQAKMQLQQVKGQ